MSDKPAAPQDRRRDFGRVMHIPTRWMDNDVYGHVNNVVYYSYFDTVINRWLISEAGLDPNDSRLRLAIATLTVATPYTGRSDQAHHHPGHDEIEIRHAGSSVSTKRTGCPFAGPVAAKSRRVARSLPCPVREPRVRSVGRPRDDLACCATRRSARARDDP